MMLIRTLLLFAAITFPAITMAQADTDVLTLDQALDIAAASRLELAVANAGVEATRQESRQQGAWLNPVFFMDLEGAPTDGDAWQNGDRVVGFQQTLSLGGRRGASHDAARQMALKAVAVKGQAARQVDASVRRAFARVLYARDLVSLNEMILQSTTTAVEIVQSRLELGSASSDELAYARLENGAAELEFVRAQADLVTARADLATALGQSTNLLPQIKGSLGEVGPLPDLEALLALVHQSPVLQAANAHAEAAEASARSASRSRIPDLDLSLGMRRFGGGSGWNEAIDAGVSFQLPLFDRGGAKVAAARANAAAGQASARLAQITMERQLRNVHLRLETADHIVRISAKDLVPAADTTLAAIEQRHVEGDAELSEVLQVRASWVRHRLNDLGVRLELDLIRADLAALL
jgi:cobalt-zinc-cadmium efflux system outer membrane protein